jgi:lysozyme
LGGKMTDANLMLLGGLGALLLIAGIYMSSQSLIKKFEGLNLNAYQDVAGIWTIGYGHKIVPTDPYYPYGQIQSITQQQADDLLKADTNAADNAIGQYVTVPLTKNQYDALESFIYNVGVTAFANSTLLAKLNGGDYQGAADEFTKWVHANGEVVPGLVARRQEEQQTFLS